MPESVFKRRADPRSAARRAELASRSWRASAKRDSGNPAFAVEWLNHKEKFNFKALPHLSEALF